VTVLFADVVRSMDIAAAVGPERLREIMGEVFRRSSVIVQRYGGTVDKFTGDGIMAVFGAPVALEDHAVRACRAALDIQTDAQHLAAEVERRNSASLQLRIGLNSGEVITGEIGSGPMSYTAVGEQVGMAQRMESVAPPRGVMVSESTARLVETTAMLGETEQVHIKGVKDAVPAHRLLGMATGRRRGRIEPTFVGRQWEMGALTGVLARAVDGNGSIVGLVGPPGIGKSRVVRELTAQARAAGAEVFTTFCESHTADLPLLAVAELLLDVAGAAGLEASAARLRVHERFSDADEEDLILLDDVLGIGDPDIAVPQIDPDARRRRLASMVNASALTRSTPAVYVIEDAHWIDTVSESLLAEFLAVVPQTSSLAVITYRPEYSGALAHGPRSQTIVLEPLDDSQMSELSADLLGKDSSVTELADLVAERAAGNPFFAEEIVRDLSERDVLVGGRGCYLCVGAPADVHVPRTLQAVIAARIDRLDPAAKRILNAAAVVGSRFAPDMLTALGIEPVLGELISAELIDQTAFGPKSEYTFRHPLVRAVAYESQLKSDRAQLHRRVAVAIDQTEQNAALIAEHLEAAGDLRHAYDWHMRAGAWSTNRDHAAAQISWERALQAADALPDDEPGVVSLRIAPRSLLCSNVFRRFHPDMLARFDELRELCMAAGDKASLAIGMSGLVMEHVVRGRLREASELASETMVLIESIDDPSLTVALSFASCVAKVQVNEMDDVLRWAQAVIDRTETEPETQSIILGSPFAMALTFRGLARWSTGRPGWRQDMRRAVSLSSVADAVSHAAVITYTYSAISHGVLVTTDAVLAEIGAATQLAEKSAEDIAVVLLKIAMGTALAESVSADADAGYDMLAQLRETCVHERYVMNAVPGMQLYQSRRLIALGDLDDAVAQARNALGDIIRICDFFNIDAGTSTLVHALLARGTDSDLAEAQAAIDRLAGERPGAPWATRDCYLLRLRALLAQARGDDAGYCDYRDRYRAMSSDLEFEGHMKWAAALP
jgi:adenylate cyclase